MLEESLKEIRVPFRGESMRPYLFDGDMLYFQESKKIEVGDIALFYENDELVAHRLIKLGGGHYFKGDSSQVLSSCEQKTFGILNSIERAGQKKKLRHNKKLASYLSAKNIKENSLFVRKFSQLLNFIFSKIQIR